MEGRQKRNGNCTKYMEAIKKNAKDFDAYIQYLGLAGKEDKDRNLSVECGQKTIAVWFKKLTIEIQKQRYLYSSK